MLEKFQFMALMFVNDLKTKHAQRDERGATAVEYGLMVALIGAFIAATVGVLGGRLDGLFQSVIDLIDGAGAPAGG